MLYLIIHSSASRAFHISFVEILRYPSDKYMRKSNQYMYEQLGSCLRLFRCVTCTRRQVIDVTDKHTYTDIIGAPYIIGVFVLSFCLSVCLSLSLSLRSALSLSLDR